MAIKNTIQYSKVSITNVSINTSFIQINSTYNNTQKKCLLGSIYIICNSQPQQLESELNIILQTCLSFDGFILGGDLNSKCSS